MVTHIKLKREQIHTDFKGAVAYESIPSQNIAQLLNNNL